MDPSTSVSLYKLITDGGPYAIALVLAFFWWRSDAERQKLQDFIIKTVPKQTLAMNRLRWFIQGRKGEEDDLEDEE